MTITSIRHYRLLSFEITKLFFLVLSRYDTVLCKSSFSFSSIKIVSLRRMRKLYRFRNLFVVFVRLNHKEDVLSRFLSFILFIVLDVVSLSRVCFVIFPVDKDIEQRICLKFCIANGISCVESLKMLQKAYGESTLSKTRA